MSSRVDELWARVNEALDARKDPLSDPAVVDLVREQPEHALQVESLTRALEAIGTWTSGPPASAGPTSKDPLQAESSRLKPAVRAAAALVLVIGGLSYWAAMHPAAPAPGPPALRARDVVKAFPTGATPVTSWSVRVERREAGVTTSDSLGPDGVRTMDTSAHESNTESARIVVHRFTRHP